MSHRDPPPLADDLAHSFKQPTGGDGTGGRGPGRWSWVKEPTGLPVSSTQINGSDYMAKQASGGR